MRGLFCIANSRGLAVLGLAPLALELVVENDVVRVCVTGRVAGSWMEKDSAVW